jgi:hypothetical protein
VRSAAVILFIAIVAAVAVYCAQRPTVARGDVLAADLVEANPLLRGLDCDKQVPIGHNGATFRCTAMFKNGDQQDYTFRISRAGKIDVAERGNARSVPRIKKTTDPWGE